jgi:NAD(P)H-flavin reductase
MTARPFRAKVQQIRNLTSDIREMILELIEPSTLSFQAGQSIAVRVPDRISSSPLLRYFSIASPPHSSKHLILLLNSQDRGKGSTFLLGKGIGEEIQISGPYGSFMLQHEPDRELLFIGTGTGVAPLWSMMATLLEEASSQPMKLLWGLRSEADRYYLQELEAWTTQHENFSYVLTLSQPTSAWQGKKGRVTDLLQELSTVDHMAAYVCGNQAMVKEVNDFLKEKVDCAIYRERHSENL